MVQELSDEQRQLAVTFMTTEQFTLQTARGTTTSEANGRSALYLSTLSSALVALGFVAQVDAFGRSFSLFALLVLLPIVFLGIITFQRVVQSMVEDVFYAQGMIRIRSLYVELVPEMRPYFIQPTRERTSGVAPEAFARGRWQPLLTVGGAIAVVNCVLVGAIVGIAADLVLGPPFAATVLTGTVVAVATVAGHYIYQQHTWERASAILSAPTAMVPPTPE